MEILAPSRLDVHFEYKFNSCFFASFESVTIFSFKRLRNEQIDHFEFCIWNETISFRVVGFVVAKNNSCHPFCIGFGGNLSIIFYKCAKISISPVDDSVVVQPDIVTMVTKSFRLAFVSPSLLIRCALSLIEWLELENNRSMSCKSALVFDNFD